MTPTQPRFSLSSIVSLEMLLKSLPATVQSFFFKGNLFKELMQLCF